MYDWQKIYHWIKKNAGLGQFGEEKTTRIEGTIKTDAYQTKDILTKKRLVE